MRSLLLAILVGVTLGCSGPAPEAEGNLAEVPAPDTPAAAPEEVIPGKAEAMEWVRKRFARTETMEADGLLDCESFSYECPDEPGGGTFEFCYADGELLRAAHEMYRGDHAGATETYYYDGEELYFSYQTEASWRFGGPLTEDAQGNETPGTVDRIHEVRRYYDTGNLIEQLYKDYEVRSWEDNPPPDQIPNRETGEGASLPLGSEAVRTAEATRKFSCY